MIRVIRICLLSALLLAPVAVRAQEGVSGPAGSRQAAGAEPVAEKHEEAPSPYGVIFRWVNFVVLFGLLGYLLRKPAGEFFEARKAGISEGLQRAEQAQKDSDLRMAEIEQRLSALSADVAGLQAQADQESAVEHDRMIAEAQHEVERIVEQSKQEMERIALGIERDIKEKIADVVIQRASQKLQTNMTQDDQKRVVVKFIKNL